MGKVILIVEDDQMIRETLKIVIENAEYTVVTAAHGQEALDRLSGMRERPGLIILDLMMPVMDGFEFLQKLQEHPFATVPVIVISAAPLTGEKELSIKPFVANFVKKPFDIVKMMKIVEEYYRG